MAGRTICLRGTGTGPDICLKTERVDLGLWSETGRLPLPHLWPQSSSARTSARHSNRSEYVAILPEYHGPAQCAYGPDSIASGIGNAAPARRRATTHDAAPEWLAVSPTTNTVGTIRPLDTGYFDDTRSLILLLAHLERWETSLSTPQRLNRSIGDSVDDAQLFIRIL